jgi:hypothetical protein
VELFDASFEEMKGEFPEILYKYRKWTDLNHRKVLTERQLFYSPPSWFEDPLDCKLVVRYDLLNSQEKIKWIEFKLKQNEPNHPRPYYRNRTRELFKTSPLRDNNAIRNLQNETFLEYDQRTGILSLTEHNENTDMWNKYSENGKGFCVGYNSVALFECLGGGGKVHYVPRLPVIKPEPFHSHDEQIVFQLYYKEDKWSFEDEYRTHTFMSQPLEICDRIITVPPNAFNCIYLGKNMEKTDKDELYASIPSELQNIPIIEM